MMTFSESKIRKMTLKIRVNRNVKEELLRLGSSYYFVRIPRLSLEHITISEIEII